LNIRPATSDDALKWIELFRAVFGEQYPVQAIYSPEWAAREIALPGGFETWVADAGNRLESAVSFLGAAPGPTAGPILNLGRNLHRSESLANGASAALLEAVSQLAAKRGQTLVTRVLAQSNSQQILYENAGFACVGFQPLKHKLAHRAGTLFYMRPDERWRSAYRPACLSPALPEARQLALASMERLRMPAPQALGDDVLGYPLHADLAIQSSGIEGYEEACRQALTANPLVEISGPFNMGSGHFRISSSQPSRSLLCSDTRGRVAGGILFRLDDLDRCVRIVDIFSTDGFCGGALFARAVKLAEEQLGADYIEVDILVSAARLLKTAEQLGFVPVAYLPGFHWHGRASEDVVKLIKLNIPHEAELGDLTAHARVIADTVAQCFEDQRLGLATLRLLRPLAMFAGLGDGDLRKISRLFTQRLFRAGDTVFNKGEHGKEAYIVLRGQIDIRLEPGAPVMASLSNGKIFGELAFLDGGPRGAFAVAAQPSIVLVLPQEAFLNLTRREPALGMAVMRNMALDIAAKLRNADAEISKTSRR